MWAALTSAAAPALASFGAHYQGSSGDHRVYRLYLDGGEFVGPRGPLHAIRTAVRIERGGRPLRSGVQCLYLYHPGGGAPDRIECGPGAGDPLAGVVYVRDAPGVAAEASARMRCAKRCSRQVPATLVLEAEGDNH